MTETTDITRTLNPYASTDTLCDDNSPIVEEKSLLRSMLDSAILLGYVGTGAFTTTTIYQVAENGEKFDFSYLATSYSITLAVTTVLAVGVECVLLSLDRYVADQPEENDYFAVIKNQKFINNND